MEMYSEVMKKIEMVDLKTQYENMKPEVDDAIQEVISSAAFINGPAVKKFADDLASYLDVKHVIPCANGTDALQIAMMALDLQPGDEVISTSFTYFATVEVIALLKLTPVFVDVDPKTFTIDVQQLRKAITSKTKCIVPVHLYGQSACMEDILEISREHKIPVIEDNAQAIGGSYTFKNGTTKKNGTMGDIGCTSFFPSKNLGCYGDGGAMFTNDNKLYEKLKMIANHGQKERYYHDMIGVNSRLDTIQAAVLNVKLNYLDKYIAARKMAADFYDEAFNGHPNITIPYRSSYSDHVFHQYTLLIDGDRNALMEYLKSKDIPSMLYYPVPAHKQKAFADKGRIVGNLEVTNWLTERVLSLPIHTEMETGQLEYITEAVLDFFSKNN